MPILLHMLFLQFVILSARAWLLEGLSDRATTCSMGYHHEAQMLESNTIANLPCTRLYSLYRLIFLCWSSIRPWIMKNKPRRHIPPMFRLPVNLPCSNDSIVFLLMSRFGKSPIEVVMSELVNQPVQPRNGDFVFCSYICFVTSEF